MIVLNKKDTLRQQDALSKNTYSSKHDEQNAPPFGSYCKAWVLALAIGGRTSIAVAARLVAAARGVLR